jgi:GTP pyrophosphokinase
VCSTLRALRVMVDDVAACYAALARVHEAWRPVDGEFDDYIARPKPNGYQSLHTVVLGELS